MRRKTLDAILTGAGAVLTPVLLIAGILLMWGYRFADSNVHNQLAAQQIFFPPKGSEALASPQTGPYLNRYAGQQLVNGAQANPNDQYAAIVSFIGAALMLLLTLLGAWHLRRTGPEEGVFGSRAETPAAST